MKKGEIKTVDNLGLKFDVKATDEYALIINNKTKVLESKQIAIIISDVPNNKYGIKKGMKMSLENL